ncbi:c-type cytochrome [Thalassotalea sp. PLHSN55]|uniref:c-type cytochrome n=1 Tax=Thalassotalea sp. PLHSN55 TaxID=3435888 RepID=UPI003F872BDE
MKKILFTLLLGLGVINTAAAFAGDAAAGKTKSATCAACHGANGISAIPLYPNLAGQPAAYIVKQLKAFKNGDRKDMMMAPMAVNLSDEDMADLAAHFASLPRNPEAAASAGASSAAAPAAGDVKIVGNFPGQAKAAACTACHGADGNSLVTMYPKLAGQGEQYLVKQIHDFKDGTRKDPVMAPMVAALSDQDIADLAEFFAAQKSTAGNGEANEVGKKLYIGGDANRGITACIACHGVKGNGMDNAAFPAVAKQNVEYLTTQLEKFRSGERQNDANNIMGDIAAKLTDDDIKALTQFMSSL